MGVFQNLINWFLSLPPLAAIVIGILAIIVFFILVLTAGAIAFILFYTFARIIKGLTSKETKK